MKREIRDYLEDIKNECEYLINRSRVIDYTSFMADEDLKRAFVRSLEVIGEAAKQLPEKFKKLHPQISWKKIEGMRNIIAHEYFGINYEVVWKTVKEEISQLKETVEKIIKEAKDK